MSVESVANNEKNATVASSAAVHTIKKTPEHTDREEQIILRGVESAVMGVCLASARRVASSGAGAVPKEARTRDARPLWSSCGGAHCAPPSHSVGLQRGHACRMHIMKGQRIERIPDINAERHWNLHVVVRVLQQGQWDSVEARLRHLAGVLRAHAAR